MNMKIKDSIVWTAFLAVMAMLLQIESPNPVRKEWFMPVWKPTER